MPRVVHFEISADDVERAKAFYGGIFGWQFQGWPGSPNEYHLVTTGDAQSPGINGGIFQRKGDIGFVNTIDVPAIDEYIAKVEQGGGTVVVPKVAVPGVGWLVYCKDTEGSVFGMMQADPSATS